MYLHLHHVYVQSLARITGVVHITGLDMNKLAHSIDDIGATERIKLAYYILSSLIGKVDGNVPMIML